MQNPGAEHWQTGLKISMYNDNACIMPCFISTDSRHVDMSTRGRRADEAFISATTNEPFAATALVAGCRVTQAQKETEREVLRFLVVHSDWILLKPN